MPISAGVLLHKAVRFGKGLGWSYNEVGTRARSQYSRIGSQESQESQDVGNHYMIRARSISYLGTRARFIYISGKGLALAIS